METLSRTRKVGGSLVVTIPAEVVEHEGLSEDQLVKIDVTKVRKSGFGIAKGLGPFTREDKFFGQLEK